MALSTLDSASPVFDFPRCVRSARRILIKPNAGYPAQPPVIVRMALLLEVVDQLLALRDDSRITIIEGVCSKTSAQQVFDVTGLSALASGRVEVLDAESVPLADYANPVPGWFKSLSAPSALREVDARISIAPLKRTTLNGRPLISATIKNLYGLLPRAQYHARSPHARGQLHRPSVHRAICEVYRTLGVHFDFGIVDAHEKFVGRGWEPDKGRAEFIGKVLCGNDLIELDCTACEVGGEPLCEYLEVLRRMTPTGLEPVFRP